MGRKRLVVVPLSEKIGIGLKATFAVGERARYDADKVRQRAEEALGWEPGSSKDMSFNLLLEALKAKPEKWKARRDIEDMLRTGDHLLEPRGRSGA